MDATSRDEGLRYNRFQYISDPNGGFCLCRPPIDPLVRMPSLQLIFMSCLLALFSANCHADIYSDVGRQVNEQNWSKARTQAEEHLKAQPTDPQMRLLLSRIQDGQGQTQEALDTLKALTQSFPELPEPHNNLAALLARQNRYSEALESLQAAVRARPDYATALENLGDVQVILAIQAYANALKVTPTAASLQRKRLAAQQLLGITP